MMKSSKIKEIQKEIDVCLDDDFTASLAEHLYNVGYRKQEELSEEIFKEIETLFLGAEMSINAADCLESQKYIDLKLKYRSR